MGDRVSILPALPVHAVDQAPPRIDSSSAIVFRSGRRFAPPRVCTPLPRRQEKARCGPLPPVLQVVQILSPKISLLRQLVSQEQVIVWLTVSIDARRRCIRQRTRVFFIHLVSITVRMSISLGQTELVQKPETHMFAFLFFGRSVAACCSSEQRRRLPFFCAAPFSQPYAWGGIPVPLSI